MLRLSDVAVLLMRSDSASARPPRLVHDGIAAHPAAILLPVGEDLAQRNIPYPTTASGASIGLQARLQTLEITDILPSR